MDVTIPYFSFLFPTPVTWPDFLNVPYSNVPTSYHPNLYHSRTTEHFNSRQIQKISFNIMPCNGKCTCIYFNVCYIYGQMFLHLSFYLIYFSPHCTVFFLHFISFHFEFVVILDCLSALHPGTLAYTFVKVIKHGPQRVKSNLMVCDGCAEMGCYFFRVSLRFLNLPSDDTVFCSLSINAFVCQGKHQSQDSTTQTSSFGRCGFNRSYCISEIKQCTAFQFSIFYGEIKCDDETNMLKMRRH